MKTIDVDARRYAWCRGHALWMVGMPAHAFVEDAHGAEVAGQDGLVDFAARMLADICVVGLNVALNFARPIPTRPMRSSWALERLRGHELWQPCWELIRGMPDAATAEKVAACDDLITRVTQVVGDMPNVLTPEGYYPAIAMARDWLKLLEAVGESNPIPVSWAQPTT